MPGIADSNPAKGIDVRLLYLLCCVGVISATNTIVAVTPQGRGGREGWKGRLLRKCICRMQNVF